MSSVKTKKMTFNMLNETVKGMEPVEIVLDEEKELVLTVKRSLDFSDAMSFVRSVAESCFDDNDEYIPEAFDISVAVNTMIFYAGVQMPKDVQKAYRVITDSDVYDMVLDIVGDSTQFRQLVGAAHKRVEHKREMIVQTNVAKVTELIAAVERMVKDNQAVMEEMNTPDFQKTLGEMMKLIAPNMPDYDEREVGADGDDKIVVLNRKDD